MSFAMIGLMVVLFVYLALGIKRGMWLHEAMTDEMKPRDSVERLAIILVSLFHVVAWLPYWIYGYMWAKKQSKNGNA